MKKRILKIGALVLATLLIVGVCMFANSLVGNPISKALAKNTAEKYIEKTYGDTDYELGDVAYNFKDGYYYAHVSSPSSIDTRFTLLINGFGKLRYDDYDYYVSNGWNTATRLDDEYRKTVDIMLESGELPYNVNFGHGELMFITQENKDRPDIPEYAMLSDGLTPDAYYNVNDLGKKVGRLTVYIDDENVTAERMAEILVGIRECFDNAGIGFYAIDCVLEYPQNTDGYYEYGMVEVIDFRYADIYEDGLVERVKAANDAANAYYSGMDAEKMSSVE
jgi:hypothetical protein